MNFERLCTIYPCTYNRFLHSYYLYRSIGADPNQTAFILVPTKQFEHFISGINKQLGTNLSIPSGRGGEGFRISFEDDGKLRPRYMGRADNKDMADILRKQCPPSYYNLDGEENVSRGKPVFV